MSECVELIKLIKEYGFEGEAAMQIGDYWQDASYGILYAFCYDWDILPL